MSTQPADVAPVTRKDALKALGLFARHDYWSIVFLSLSWVGWFVMLVAGMDSGSFWRIIVGWAGLNVVVTTAWVVVLVYRALIFILDLHAEVALMPEASARIAVGYFEGRKR